MLTKPKSMNDSTWKLILKAREMMLRTKIPFDTCYEKLRLLKVERAEASASDFAAEVERVMAERKISRGAAVRIVVAENPKLHEAWLNSLKPEGGNENANR